MDSVIELSTFTKSLNNNVKKTIPPDPNFRLKYTK